MTAQRPVAVARSAALGPGEDALAMAPAALRTSGHGPGKEDPGKGEVPCGHTALPNTQEHYCALAGGPCSRPRTVYREVFVLAPTGRQTLALVLAGEALLAIIVAGAYLL